MKYIVLFLIILFIIIFFKIFSINRKSNNSKKDIKEEIIDLKKDPKTNEYKPKE